MTESISSERQDAKDDLDEAGDDVSRAADRTGDKSVTQPRASRTTRRRSATSCPTRSRTSSRATRTVTATDHLRLT